MQWLAYARASFAALFPIVNPLPAIPLFTGLTPGATERERQHMARRTGLYVFVVLVFTQVLGRLVLQLFGLSLGVLQIAGGLIVAHSAWAMATGAPRVSDQERQAIRAPSWAKLFRRHARERQRGRIRSMPSPVAGAARNGTEPAPAAPSPQHRKPAPDISFTPMAMPLLAGPGAMGIVVGLEAQSDNIVDSLGVTLGILGIGLLTAVCLMASGPLGRAMSPGALVAMQRIFGFIILGIAVALVSSGISALFGIPLHGAA